MLQRAPLARPARRTIRRRSSTTARCRRRKRSVGTLERDRAERSKQSSDRRPAILVVGRVAALREHLRWFDARPLFGKRILVTRPREQAAELVELLEALGAEAIEAPMIRIAPPEDYGPLDEACARVGEFDWIVFSSANAVDAFIERLLAGAARSARARTA